ncbi:MAG TPA: hypothetical protein VFW31_03125 [Candidatus Angelobacter sp.]|nr:hypothetical protein [Candidatus Angelobacter sp.]
MSDTFCQLKPAEQFLSRRIFETNETIMCLSSTIEIRKAAEGRISLNKQVTELPIGMTGVPAATEALIPGVEDL